MTREVNLCRDLIAGGAGRLCGRDEQALMEDTLEGLQERTGLLESSLEQYCDSMKDRLQDHSHIQVCRQWKHSPKWKMFLLLIISVNPVNFVLSRMN